MKFSQTTSATDPLAFLDDVWPRIDRSADQAGTAVKARKPRAKSAKAQAKADKKAALAAAATPPVAPPADGPVVAEKAPKAKAEKKVKVAKVALSPLATKIAIAEAVHAKKPFGARGLAILADWRVQLAAETATQVSA